MRTVFVGSDETGRYRPMNADELQVEVDRLLRINSAVATENERLREAMARADANGHHNRQCVIYQSGPVAPNQPRCSCWKADLLAAMAE